MSQHISDLQLELLALDALPAKEARALRAALAHDAEAQARFENLKKSSVDLFKEFPPEQVNAEVVRRVEILAAEESTSAAIEWRVVWRSWLWAPVAAAAMVALLVVELPLGSDSGFRVKGESQLLVHRITPQANVLLANGDVARAGERLQLSIAPAGRVFAVVFSIDGNGHTTLHFPRDGGPGEVVAAGTPFSLPTSYRLDDAPDFERFYLVTTPAALDAQDIIEHAGALAKKIHGAQELRLEFLPDNARQHSFLVRKVK
jgi:hypothetical protein